MDMKTQRVGSIIKLIIWIAVLGILMSAFFMGFEEDGCLGNGIISLGGIRYDHPESYSVGNMEYSESVKNMDINWLSGSVKIATYEGSTVKVEETPVVEDEDERMRVKLENGKLTVQYAASGIGMINVSGKSLTIYIPRSDAEGQLGLVELDDASSSVEIVGITASKLEIDTASGGVDVKNSVIRDVEVDCASSSVKLDGSFQRIDIDSASGNATVIGEASDITIDTASGDCIMQLTALPYAVDCDSASGDIMIEAPLGDGFRLDFDGGSGKAAVNLSDGSKLSGDKLTVGKGSASFKIDTASGDFTFNEK